MPWYRKGTAIEKAKTVWELRHKYPVILLIDIAKLPRSTYYYYAKHMEKSDKYAKIKEHITE